jgi:hypothetical protein
MFYTALGPHMTMSCKPGVKRGHLWHQETMPAGDAWWVSRELDSAEELHVLCHSGSTHDDVMQARGERKAFAISRSDADGRCHAGEL